MIERIRLEQQQSQISELRKLPTVPAAATYQYRDTVSGLRVLQSADGGEVRAKYLSYTQPVEVPLIVGGGSLQQSFMVSR
jgi:hypothetical protein